MHYAAYMELADWGTRWREGRIGFHQSEVTDFLAKYADRVWGDSVGRVLVPLCGKTLDMVFLAERADAVVGVEFAEQAVNEFFAERSLDPDIETGSPARYAADKYTLFAGDFFTVTPEHVGEIDAVFDRAALVALDADARLRYADRLRTLMRRGAKSLLVTFDYDQAEMEGPPFAVSAEEVERLFGDSFTVEHLETKDVLNDMFRERGLSAMTSSAFALTRR